MSAFAICWICLLLVLLNVCAFVLAKYEDEIVALKKTVAKADEVVAFSHTKIAFWKGEELGLREYVEDHVHAFIDSGDISELLSFAEWQKKGGKA